MYWNTASWPTYQAVSWLTLTWDVLKSCQRPVVSSKGQRLTLTWDVLKLKWMFYKTPCSTD